MLVKFNINMIKVNPWHGYAGHLLTYCKFERHDVPVSAVLLVTCVRIQVTVRDKATHPVITHFQY